MLSKPSIKKEFSKDWKKHYQVELFREKGFIRKTCPGCGKNFWTLDPERVRCADPPCENYSFINNTITKRKWDYIEMWKEFERFFKKEGHTSIPRYPVVDRWRPDLYFTIASIQDFQRLENGNMTFEYPANPLIVPQVCLRFPDIPNVGVTGRHLTSFVMSGQHAFGYPKDGYFKDRCIELNYKFLNSVMGIPGEELVYAEDVWAMPDFSAFGPSMETFSRGLELVNSVFMQFQSKDMKTYVDLPLKVIDVGWGHERLVWFSNGTPAAYDSLFGPVTPKMKKLSSIDIDQDAFDRYSVIAGNLNMDEVKDIEKARIDAAKSVGVTVREMQKTVEPMQALYAVADHARTLLFAISDGGIPSNVGGGYNLRAILRRALNFIDRYNFDFTIHDVASWHADYLKPMYPELKENIANVEKIVSIEEEKYKKTMQRSKRIVSNLLQKTNTFTESKLTELYESHGITPELIEKVASDESIDVHIPGDFYMQVAQKHESGGAKIKKIDIDVSGLQATRALYYESEKPDFTAKIERIICGKWIVLDKTAFYPTGGGQDHDVGTINGINVTNVMKVDGVILHEVKEPIGLKAGAVISGKVDERRRKIITQFHTGTHVLGGALRSVLGPHIWRAGAHKSEGGARLDITHYDNLTDEEIKKVEEAANKIIKENIKLDITNIPRSEAESKYGFIIYQGGGSPGKMVRIIKIGDHDVEACGGTHVKSTGDICAIKIAKTHKIQDGVIRVEFLVGDLVKSIGSEIEKLAKDIKKELNISDIKDAPKGSASLFKEWKELRKINGQVFYFIKSGDKEGIEKMREEYRKTTAAKEEKANSEHPKDSAEAIRKTAEILKVQQEHIINTLKRFKKEIETFRESIENNLK
ncbi:MAG: alanine--tRNA ligase [archaeon]